MKKIATLTLLLATVLWTGLQAQTNAPADASAPTNAPAAPAVAASPAPADAVSTNVAVAPAAPAPADTNAPAAPAPAAPVATEATTSTNAPGAIPLIRFTDVPLTTAIENLALQANINYLIDPKINYGQPDASGQIKAEPVLSIRWENISAESALLALLDNYGLQLNRDKNTGIARITMKDPTAPPPLITRVVQLQYASTTNMTEAVVSVLTDKRSKVMPDTRSSQIIVVATDPEQSAVDTLIKQLDTPTKQVLIETKLVEVSSQPSTKKGVDWSSTLSAQSVTFGNGKIQPSGSATTVSTGTGSSTVTTPTSIPLTTSSSAGSSSTILNLLQGNGGFAASTISGLIPYTAFLNADGVNAVISFINATYDAQIMSTPRIVTLDNQTAKIEVSRQFPVINLSGGTQNNSGSLGISYSNVGTFLEVTPRISANQKIWLSVIPEVSSHFADVTVTVPGGNGNPSTSFPVPIFDARKLVTQVLIPNGNTLVMGGLVQDSPTATYSKVPVLGDIPVLGWGFRSEGKTMDKDNLLIFMTPTIIQDSDFAATPEAEDFLKSKPTPMQSRMNPNTWWDSGRPRGNWSNPAPVPGEFDSQPALHNF